jgi:hypothetical protein
VDPLIKRRSLLHFEGDLLNFVLDSILLFGLIYLNFKYTNGMSTLANNQYDAIESIIFTEDLRIEALDFHPEQDLMLVVLSTKVVLTQKLSSYKNLVAADKSQLLQYELVGRGTGVHWPLLDEDLSLKGFLQNELRKVVKTDKGSVAA